MLMSSGKRSFPIFIMAVKGGSPFANPPVSAVDR